MNRRRRGTKRTHHGFCKACGTKLYRGRCASCEELYPQQQDTPYVARPPKIEPGASARQDPARRASTRPTGTQRSHTTSHRSTNSPEGFRDAYERELYGGGGEQRAQAERASPLGCIASFIRIGCAIFFLIVLIFVALTVVGACLDFAGAAAPPPSEAPAHAARAEGFSETIASGQNAYDDGAYHDGPEAAPAPHSAMKGERIELEARRNIGARDA